AGAGRPAHPPHRDDHGRRGRRRDRGRHHAARPGGVAAGKVLAVELTGRGKTLLAVSAAVGLTALLVGEGDLLRAALLAAIAPIGGLVLLMWTRPTLESNRVLNPAQVEAGQPTQVRLGIPNTGRRRPPALMLEDRIPYRLGNRPRLVLERLAPGARSVVNYTIVPGARGAYELGPLRVRSSDPFGLALSRQEFPMTT